jgi:hypothetical protein
MGCPDGRGRVPCVGLGPEQRWRVLCAADINGCQSPQSGGCGL